MLPTFGEKFGLDSLRGSNHLMPPCQGNSSESFCYPNGRIRTLRSWQPAPRSSSNTTVILRRAGASVSIPSSGHSVFLLSCHFLYRFLNHSPKKSWGGGVEGVFEAAKELFAELGSGYEESVHRKGLAVELKANKFLFAKRLHTMSITRDTALVGGTLIL